jgi:two-component system NtrC family sensor kinase
MQKFSLVPPLGFLSMMVIVFTALYIRARTPRRLYWLLGWSMTVLRLICQTTSFGQHGIGLAVSNGALQLAALMFLGSMSPLRLRGKLRIPYVVAFAVPLLALVVLISLFPSPSPLMRVAMLVAAAAAAFVATHWSAQENLLPVWFTLLFAILGSAVCIWFLWIGEYDRSLYLIHGANSFITALLFMAAYRRFSPGVFFSSSGLLVWSLTVMLGGSLPVEGVWSLFFFRALNLSRALTAVGMVVLVLEDEIAMNEASQKRDRRARAELEQYSKLDLSITPDSEFGISYDQVCEVIVQTSRFQQAAILVRSVERNYHVAGKAGMEGALVGALDELGRRLTIEKAKEFGASDQVVSELGNTVLVNLSPLFEPGDELERLNYVQVHVIPMLTRTGMLEGTLMLSKIKDPSEPLQADDLLPLELLTARITAMREKDFLLYRIAQSEKLAGLGHLAAGVAHELNNPLTVVMGYAELIEEGDCDQRLQQHAAVIGKEAHRMKQIIESLMRFSKPSPTGQTAISLEEILQDIARLRQPELDRKGIDFQLKIENQLPKIRANGDQLRQVLLQVMNNSISALAELPPGQARRMRLDAIHSQDRLQIIMADSGPGFPDPHHVFDPFYTTRQPGEGMGLGLSFCYSIIREHGGEISASNLHPRGAALVIEIPTHTITPPLSPNGETIIR